MSEQEDLENFAKALQEQIMEQARKEYSEPVIDRWINPRHQGTLEQPDGYGKVTGSCGDTIEIWLKVKNGAIVNATFMTDGCGTSIASGSMVTELARGKSISEARSISQQDVLGALGGLPEESEHCALLAANTLKEAMRDYIAMKKELWKRAYRKH